MELHMKNCHLQDSSGKLTQHLDHHTFSPSSSSSFRSLSYDIDIPADYYSQLLYNIPSGSAISHDPETTTSRSTFVTSVLIQYQQAVQALSRIRNVHVPTIESEDAAIVNAIYNVLSSPSSTSSSIQPQPFLSPAPIAPVYQGNKAGTSAFKVYNRQSLPPKNRISVKNHRDNLINRSIMFLRTMNTSSSKDLQHILFERKRREKLNESFQALRSFLPAGTKKDKASMLAVAADYLTSLKAQISELSKKNQTLELKLSTQRSSAAKEAIFDSLNQRLDIGIMHLGESSSKVARMIELQIIRLGEASMVDMVVNILQFLKDDQKMSLMSVEATTTLVDSTPLNRIILRLKIEGMEWEEYAFQEAVRRVVSQL